MRPQIKFADDIQAAKFQGDLANLLNFLKEEKKFQHIKVVQQLVNDNVNLFNKVKELENGE